MTTAIEYGLIAAGISIGIISAIFIVGDELSMLFDGSMQSKINTVSTVTVICEGQEPIIAETAWSNSNGTTIHLKNGDELNYSVAHKCLVSRTTSSKEELD